MSPPVSTCVCTCTTRVHMHTRVWLPTYLAYTCTRVYTHPVYTFTHMRGYIHTLCTFAHVCTHPPCVHIHTCCDYTHSLCASAYMYMGTCIPLVLMHRNMWVYAHSLCTCTHVCTVAGGHDLGRAAWVKGSVRGWEWLLIQCTDARISGCPFRDTSQTPPPPPHPSRKQASLEICRRTELLTQSWWEQV